VLIPVDLSWRLKYSLLGYNCVFSYLYAMILAQIGKVSKLLIGHTSYWHWLATRLRTILSRKRVSLYLSASGIRFI
jgi:hypothetical protein